MVDQRRTRDAKAEARSRIREQRAARSAQRRAQDARELGAVLAAQLGGAQDVIGYAALPGEPDIDVFLDGLLAAGRTVLLPATRTGEPLRFGSPQGTMGDLPRRGRWRIREPEATLSAAEALLAAADVLLVPGLAFSRSGVRLGNGGGFYDRTFGPLGAAPVSGAAPGAAPGIRVLGVCFCDEVVDELPVEPWDLRVDGIITEQGLLPVAAAL